MIKIYKKRIIKPSKLFPYVIRNLTMDYEVLMQIERCSHIA